MPSTQETKDIHLNISYEYIPRIKFTPKDHLLSVQTLNRHQNTLNFMMVNLKENKAKTIFTEKSDTYIDVTDNLTFFKDKDQFIWTSERSGFNHIYIYNYGGDLIRAVTSGDYDVDQYIGFDQTNNTLFFTSAEVSPLQRHLYSISLKGDNKKQITQRNGMHSITFSKGFKYYIDNYSNANTPPEYSLYQLGTKVKRTIEDNKALKEKLEKFSLGKKEFFSFKNEEGVKLNGYMVKPSDFDSRKKYPVLMYVYGGPGSQTVTDQWGGSGLMWQHMLAQKGYVVVSVDNRGTGFRGVEFKKCTYKNLGKIETQDQISAAKYLGGLPYVDKDRIGIWGWSYGGYMSSLCITKGTEIFKMAMAVAPVTNWKYYDSIYTERYMQTPDENPGYDLNAPIEHAHKLNGPYLLVHGMADDNVHFQNSIEMVNKLIEEDKHFDFYMYPGRNHGIYGGNTRYHLYNKLTDFVLENL